MTGAELAALMVDGWLKRALAKHARRYSKKVENQEEYIQDAWLRISEEPGNRTIEWYAEQGGKAVKAAYYRRRYVQKKDGGNLYGINREEEKPIVPDRAIHLHRNKWLDPKPEMLDWQYYEGEAEEVAGNRPHKWYKQHDGYHELSEREKKSVDDWYRENGFSVGAPKGGTYGSKTPFHKIIVT